MLKLVLFILEQADMKNWSLIIQNLCPVIWSPTNSKVEICSQLVPSKTEELTSHSTEYNAKQNISWFVENLLDSDLCLYFL